jgi:hypothetical protein
VSKRGGGVIIKAPASIQSGGVYNGTVACGELYRAYVLGSSDLDKICENCCASCSFDWQKINIRSF